MTVPDWSQLAVSPVPRKRFSFWWLAVAAAVGLILIGFHLSWSYGGGEHPLSNVFVTIGSALLLFAVLLIYQDRLVERAVAATIRGLSKEEREYVTNTMADNPLTPGDFHSDIGPLAIARAFLGELKRGNFNDAWLITHPNWKLCRAQAWIFNNRTQLDLADSVADWQQLADVLASGPHPGLGLWDAFAQSESALLATALSTFDEKGWGWSQRRRIIGPAHELLLAAPLPAELKHGFVAERPTLLGTTIQILVHCIDVPGRYTYLVEGINMTAPPQPGWPPSWWLLDDPVAQAAHPGVRAAPEANEVASD